MVLFVLCLLVREDAGFHLVAILGLVGLINVLRGRTWHTQKPLIVFLSTAFIYSVTVILLQKQFFPGDNAAQRVYGVTGISNYLEELAVQ